MGRAKPGALDLRKRRQLAHWRQRMSTRADDVPKLAGAHAALFNGLSSGPDVPGGSSTSVVLGWASRTRCDEPLPAVAANTIARGRAAPMPMHAFEGRAGGHLSNSEKGCSGEDERAGLYRLRAHGPRRCRDGGSLGPQGYVELPVSESGRMAESPLMSGPAPGIEAMGGQGATDRG